MENMANLIKNEVKFCEEIDLEKNEHGQFIYTSSNGISSTSIPFLLQEYKQWLIENKIVKEL